MQSGTFDLKQQFTETITVRLPPPASAAAAGAGGAAPAVTPGAPLAYGQPPAAPGARGAPHSASAPESVASSARRPPTAGAPDVPPWPLAREGGGGGGPAVSMGAAGSAVGGGGLGGCANTTVHSGSSRSTLSGARTGPQVVERGRLRPWRAGDAWQPAALLAHGPLPWPAASQLCP
jgi:hypothetical protein